MSKLWEYLSNRMLKHKDNIVYKDMTYGQFIDSVIHKANSHVANSTIEIVTREKPLDFLMDILTLIAAGITAVPMSLSYGMEKVRKVQQIILQSSFNDKDIPLIMFTSGSSGNPKGVMLTHDNIISNIEAIEDYFNITNLDRIFIIRPLCHVAVLSGEVFLGLVNGCELFFNEEDLNIKRLYSQINENKITILGGTPTLFSLLATNRGDWSVKKAIISGEILTEKKAKAFQVKWSATSFYSVYGLTEAAPRVSALMPNEFTRYAGSVGKPIKGVEVKIINGELYIKSKSVMKGYYNDEAQTSSRIKDGWLRSGDIAEIIDERIYIRGRIDDMIIRSGVNIYPAEIINHIGKIEGVLNCKIIAVNDDNCGQKIKCRIYGDVEKVTVLQYLKENVPQYLRPTEIEIVNGQLTSSGKIQ